MIAKATAADVELCVNGKRSLNGKRFGVTLHGDLGSDAGASIYELAAEAVLHAGTLCPEVEIPDSLRLTITIKP